MSKYLIPTLLFLCFGVLMIFSLNQSSAQNTSRILRKRQIHTKKINNNIEEDRWSGEIVVKFLDDPSITSSKGKLSYDFNVAAQEMLSTADNAVSPLVIQSEVASINNLLDLQNTDLNRLFTASDLELKSRKERAEEVSGNQMPDLRSYHVIKFDKKDINRAKALLDILNGLSVVEVAYPGHIFTVAQINTDPTDIDPVTPNFTANQGYLDNAPAGIGARTAWQTPGGDGAGINIADVEYAWRVDHEDLRAPAFIEASNIQAGQETQVFHNHDYRHHGTGVLGIIGAVNNNYGITGIAHAANIGISSPLNFDDTHSYEIGIVNAISNAQDHLNAGDVMLLELQMAGPKSGVQCDGTCYVCSQASQFESVPVEFSAAVFDAIRTATNANIIVVEAAGNGAMNLDSSIYNRAFDRSFRNSGAIIVAGGTSNQRSTHCWTTYGSRVDVQAWGDSTATTFSNARGAYNNDSGVLFNGNGTEPERQTYINNFGGSSGASAIITGVVASIQGARVARGLPRLTPAQMANLLKSTGTYQADDRRQIGPMPDLVRAFNATFVNNLTPVINSISPADNSTFFAPANVAVSVNTQDTDGSISRVEFYRDGTRVGTDTSSPYSFTISNLAAGNYTITVRVTDNRNTTTYSNPIRIKVENPPPPIMNEVENLVVAAKSSDSHVVESDAVASGGKWAKLASNAAGDYVTYTVNIPTTGTYNIKVRVKKANNRGKFQFAIAPTTSGTYTNYGSVQDLYSSSFTYTELNIANVNFTSAGNKAFRFKVTSKNISSSSYQLGFDYIKLSRQ